MLLRSGFAKRVVSRATALRGLGTHSPDAAPSEAEARLLTPHPSNNMTSRVASHVGRGLLHRSGHPLAIIKSLIKAHFDRTYLSADGSPLFSLYDDLDPVVTTKQCFDELLIPADHISRSSSDTYYLDDGHVLRTHTSAHQTELLRAGERAFLVAGDVYRRDAIDASHYTVFHQMEGVRVFSDGTSQAEMELELRETLASLVRSLFGDVRMRWVDAYFPFTDPSSELEIHFNGDWLEVLGCGVVHREIMANCGLSEEHGHRGWAFGLGLERLAMVLFEIPDIRLFWSEDERFISQFRDGEITPFKPFSKYSPCLKDYSFWLPPAADVGSGGMAEVHENDVCSVLRTVAGDLVEKAELIDEYRPSATKHALVAPLAGFLRTRAPCLLSST